MDINQSIIFNQADKYYSLELSRIDINIIFLFCVFDVLERTINLTPLLNKVVKGKSYCLIVYQTQK